MTGPSSIPASATGTGEIVSYPYVLVDSSYVTYFVASSVFSWYKREFGKPASRPWDPSTDEEYIRVFDKQFLFKIVRSINKEVPLLDRSRMVFATDCPKSAIWRNDYHQQYKIRRKEAKKEDREIDYGKMFCRVRDILLPTLSEEYGCKVIGNSSAEGDDILAILAKHLTNRGEEVVIVTCDNDLLQVGTTVIDLMGKKKDLNEIMQRKYKFDPKFVWTTSKFKLLKALAGDGGDDVPAVMRGMGPKTAFKYIKDLNMLRELLSSSKEIKEAFDRNVMLTDLDAIPSIITEDVLDKWKKLTTNSFSEL